MDDEGQPIYAASHIIWAAMQVPAPASTPGTLWILVMHAE